MRATVERERAWPRAVGSAIVAAAMLFVVGGCGRDDEGKAGGKKVLILGCDGMDPVLVEKLMSEGRLPNFATLAREGGFKPLTTSIPPQSPVAWSNFITGAGPGVHGIYDFIHRDPGKPVPMPYWSGNEVVAVEKKEPWVLGQYEVPRDKTENHLLRRGTPFWDYLDRLGIPVYLYRIPANYPPSVSKYGNVRAMSDMGVPDALGNQGTYQHYSSRRRRDSKGGEGYQLRFRYDYKSGAYIGKLYGPPNEFKAKHPELTVDLRVYPDPENNVAKIVFENEGIASTEAVEAVLNVGEWSEWTEVYFLKTPMGPSFGTMVRFYLQEVRPDLKLFVSPLNFIPTAPAAVFSDPPDFAAEIGQAIGPFYTQGFAENFNARKHNLFSDDEYRTQAWFVLEERFKILDYALDHFKEGLLYFYFSSTDLMAHIFWWNSQAKHPVRSPEDAAKYHQVIEDLYVEMDKALALCRERLGGDATIIVLSDHGFCEFRRGVGVNTWLRNEGYLVSKNGLLVDTDWSKTKAYSLGVGGHVYLNLKGREKQGIVEENERKALIDEIAAKLLLVTDPADGKPVFKRIYKAEEWYQGPEAKNAPDLVLGYERDYRASWNTCLGDFDEAVIVDNDNAWSADHCIAHDLVPGILLSNRTIRMDEPALVDVAPSVLSLFGVAKGEQMTGNSFFDVQKDAPAAPVSAR